MSEELAKAKRYALKLLNIRPRSVAEFRDKLTRKKFAPEIISEVQEYCLRCGYLNDALFAKSWILSRLHSRPKSRRMIGIELEKKGLNKELIDTVMRENGLTSDTDMESARKIAAGRYEKLRAMDGETVKRRLSGFLARRGFSSQCIYNVIKELIENEGG